MKNLTKVTKCKMMEMVKNINASTFNGEQKGSAVSPAITVSKSRQRLRRVAVRVVRAGADLAAPPAGAPPQ